MLDAIPSSDEVACIILQADQYLPTCQQLLQYLLWEPLDTVQLRAIALHVPTLLSPRFCEEAGRFDTQQAVGGKAEMKTFCLDFVFHILTAGPCTLDMVENFMAELVLSSLTKTPPISVAR